MPKHLINWFEIPVSDMDRAKKFYEDLLQLQMQPFQIEGLEMVLFPMEDGITGGALVRHPDYYKPSEDGRLLYLNANPDIQSVIDRVEPAGGKVLTPRRLITEDIGYMAVFLDTEGNKMALFAAD